LSKCGKAKTISDLNSAGRKEHAREEYCLKYRFFLLEISPNFFLGLKKRQSAKVTESLPDNLISLNISALKLTRRAPPFVG
jgi:hypothetical protein